MGDLEASVSEFAAQRAEAEAALTKAFPVRKAPRPSMIGMQQGVTTRMRVRQKLLLGAIERSDGAIKIACAATGISYGTHRRWMIQDPYYNQQVRAIRARHAGRPGDVPDAAQWPQTFEEHRMRYFGRTTYAHQSKLVRVLDSVKERQIVLVLIHPEAGKTATIEDWLCKKIGENPDLRVTYLTESQDLSRKVLAFIKGRMTEPEWADYQGVYGPFHVDGQEKDGKPWTTNYVTVYKASHQERDYTIQCRAVQSRAYGSRIDLLIGDDIQSRETYGQTDKILEHLRQTYFTRGKRMTMVFVGTRIGPGDVYERMIDEGLIDDLIQIPAANGEEPLVPEAWAHRDDYETEDLFFEGARYNMARIRRQVREEVWQSSYQQNPRSNQLASFSTEVLEAAKDRERRAMPASPGSLVYLGLDPALGGQNAIVAARYAADKLELLDLQTDEGFSQTEQILGRIREMAQQYRPTNLIVEKNSFQRGLANDYRLAQLSQELGFFIRHHETGSEKTDPILGVAAMAGSFLAHEIRVPDGDDYTRLRFKALFDQLDSWRPNVPTRLLKQDSVMALWFVWKNWQEWRKTTRVTQPHAQRRPSWLRELAGSRPHF